MLSVCLIDWCLESSWTKYFHPPIPSDKEGKAIIAPYPLRKVEAVVASKGFKVAVVPPEKIEMFIKKHNP